MNSVVVGRPRASGGSRAVDQLRRPAGGVAEIRRLLGERRLVTLTGPGGVGKTRLAGQVMDQLTRAFDDGVVFVGLAELRDDDLLANLVADRLGLHDQSGRPTVQSVLAFLRARRTLLVLDNCEHLVDACAIFVARVVADCPQVVVLTTSVQNILTKLDFTSRTQIVTWVADRRQDPG